MGTNDRFGIKGIKEKVAQVECPSKLSMKMIFQCFWNAGRNNEKIVTFFSSTMKMLH